MQGMTFHDEHLQMRRASGTCKAYRSIVFLAGPSTDVAVDFLRSPLAFIDSLTQHYGRTIGLKLGGEHVVLTGDPQVSRQVLIDQATVFVKVGHGI